MVVAEGEGGNDGDALFVEEMLGEAGGAVDEPAGDGAADDLLDVDHDVERALGQLAGEPLGLVDEAVRQAAAGVVFVDHGANVLVAAGDGRGGGVLGDGVGVGRGMALEGGHGLDDLLGAGGVADAPAGHGIGLGNAVDDDGLLLDLRAEGGDAAVLFVVVDELFVDLVGDDVEAALHGQIGDGLKLRAAPDAAVGVVGRVDDERLRPVGDVGTQHVGGDDEVVLLAAAHHHRHAAGHAHHLGIAQPAGRGQKHLVAGIEQHAQGCEDGLLRAAGDDHLRGRVVHAVVQMELFADFLAQIQRARHGRVARDARVDGEFARVVDVFRRAEVRLAGGKTDHVHALGAQLLGARVDDQRDGGRNRESAFGESKRHKKHILSAAKAARKSY